MTQYSINIKNIYNISEIIPMFPHFVWTLWCLATNLCFSWPDQWNIHSFMNEWNSSPDRQFWGLWTPQAVHRPSQQTHSHKTGTQVWQHTNQYQPIPTNTNQYQPKKCQSRKLNNFAESLRQSKISYYNSKLSLYQVYTASNWIALSD